MLAFADSTALLDRPDLLRSRLDDDGYLFVRQVVDKCQLEELREQITAICASHHWLRPATAVIDAIPAVEPCVEGEPRYFEVYDEVQRLEALHALPHHESVRRIMSAVLGEHAFPHPLSIARLAFPRNERWTTPPHQDYPNNQGTADLYAIWMPLGDCPVERGSLSILRGSHTCGIAPLEFSLGDGNRKAVLDERFAGLDWVGGDLSTGDALVFHSHTVHRALPNRSDRLRLSVDYRFQREGEPLTEGCLQPHFGRLTWDEIYGGWTRPELQYYWRARRFSIVPWDESVHALSERHVQDAVRAWLLWRRDRAAGVERPAGWQPRWKGWSG
jgi:ectoine hydroxylase-related dioxygenase (phytanoyl-CoA dioxygenase family)